MSTESAKPAKQAKRRGGLSDAEKKEWIAAHPFGFVNLSLTESEKEQIAADPVTAARMMELLWDAITLEYKIGFSWDGQHRCHIISMTSIKFLRDDYNRCVSSRHSDLWVALAIAEYKFYHIIKPNGIPVEDEKTREIFD